MIRIITDSTAYLPADIVAQYKISVVSLKVQFGDESIDEINLTNTELYQRLQDGAQFPSTSQPAAGEFLAVYQQILAEDPESQILVITISSGLSGTLASAQTAANQLLEANITLFDSFSSAMGLGLMVIEAAKMAEHGSDIPAILRRIEQMRDQTHIVLVVDTLEYLRRGGRIGTAAAFVGTLLNAKPIIAVKNGKLEPVTRIRTKRKAVKKMLSYLEERLKTPDQPIHMGAMHISAADEVNALYETLKTRFNITSYYQAELGGVLSAHLGPGAVGVGFVPQK